VICTVILVLRYKKAKALRIVMQPN